MLMMVVSKIKMCWWIAIWNKIHLNKVHFFVFYILRNTNSWSNKQCHYNKSTYSIAEIWFPNTLRLCVISQSELICRNDQERISERVNSLSIPRKICSQHNRDRPSINCKAMRGIGSGLLNSCINPVHNSLVNA